MGRTLVEAASPPLYRAFHAARTPRLQIKSYFLAKIRIADEVVAALTTERDALKAEVGRLEKFAGKAAKPQASGGGGGKKLPADEWMAEELKKGK